MHEQHWQFVAEQLRVAVRLQQGKRRVGGSSRCCCRQRGLLPSMRWWVDKSGQRLDVDGEC